MKNKLKVLIPLLFVIALLAVIPFAVNADECAHEWSEWEVIQEGGCHKSATWRGIIKRSCSLCGETEKEYTPIVHSEIVFVKASSPQCDKLGSKVDHYRCNRCESLWIDSELQNSASKNDVYINKHSTKNLTYLTKKEPTCTEDGWFAHYYCPDCGYRKIGEDGYVATYSPILTTLGHVYDANGICTVCGDSKEPIVSVNELDITVSNLDGVRDFLIAPGRHTEYFTIKLMYTARVTSAKFNGANSYTCTMNKPGSYTVLVRYDDPSKAQTYHVVNLEAVMPVVTVNGIEANITNLEGIRVIRTAPGKWSTPGEVKRAEGSRNIPARYINESEPYDIRYSTGGTYTISLEYNNGLIVIRQIEITPKVPTVDHVGHRITFGDLDDLYVIRYAPGEFTYAGDIKRAEGARYIRPSAIDENGEIKIELPEGLYTFCVQYNDGSYNYYTIEAKIPLLEKYGLTASGDCWMEYLHREYGDGKFAVTFERDPANQLELPEITASAKIEVKHYNSYQNKYSTLITVTSELNRTTNGKYILPQDVMETIGRRISEYDSDKVVFAEITFNSADRTETVMLEIDLKETKDYGELLGKYGLSHTASVWVDLMPGMGAPKSFDISFKSVDGSEVPEMSINAVFSQDGMSIVRELRHDSSSNIYRASLGGGYYDYGYDELWFDKGDTVHVELTITINGESETIELDLVTEAVY